MSTATGKTKGQVDRNFMAYMQKLQAHAQILQNAEQGKHVRTWFSPVPAGNAPEPLPDPLLDRTDLNTKYWEVMLKNDPGTLGDAVGIKMQIDYLAAAERAQRIRNCSMPRAMVLAHARRYGQGQGSLFTDGPGGIIAAVSGAIATGGLRSNA